MAPVTNSRDEKTTDGIDTILPVVIFSYKTSAPGKRPAAKNAREIIPKNFNGFTFINMNNRVLPIFMPSPRGSSFVLDPLLRPYIIGISMTLYPLASASTVISTSISKLSLKRTRSLNVFL